MKEYPNLKGVKEYNSMMFIGGDTVKFKNATVGEYYVLQCAANSASGYGCSGSWQVVQLLQKKHGGFLWWTTDEIVVRNLVSGKEHEYTYIYTGNHFLIEPDKNRFK